MRRHFGYQATEGKVENVEERTGPFLKQLEENLSIVHTTYRWCIKKAALSCCPIPCNRSSPFRIPISQIRTATRRIMSQSWVVRRGGLPALEDAIVSGGKRGSVMKTQTHNIIGSYTTKALVSL